MHKKLSALHGHCDFLTEESKRLAAAVERDGERFSVLQGLVESEVQAMRSHMAHIAKRQTSVRGRRAVGIH